MRLREAPQQQPVRTNAVAAQQRRRPSPAALEHALRLTARFVVAPGGDVYTPIFERLEAELAACTQRKATIDRARALAGGIRRNLAPADDERSSNERGTD